MFVIAEERLTEQEVNDVLNVWNFLEFSNSYRNQYYNNSYFTPDIVNRQMQNITLNPVDITIKDIEEALKHPKDSEDVLRNYSTTLEVQNMYYKRLIRYISDMPCFNLNYTVSNVIKDSEYKSKEFKEDLKILETFCDRFNFKEEFPKVLRQVLRQGAFFSVLRDDGQKWVLQELPPDFCMITGRHDYGILFDFDMNWFLGNYGVDINMYPKIFKKMYRDIFNKIKQNYDPARPIDRRSATFVYWHQCSPEDGFWAWKANPELATIIPYYAALFPEMATQPTVRNLQEDKYFIEASKLLVGILGINKDNKSGNVNNQINITPDILGKFLGIARQGLARQIGITALPMDDVKAVEFDTKERNMLTEYVQNITQQSVASSAALLNDSKLNVHQSKLAVAIDENLITSMYPMFANFVEFYVNRQTKKYKFKISFHDANTPDNRLDRQNRFKAMSQLGFVDFQEAARIYDITPFELNRKLSMTKAMDIEDKLTSLMAINQMKAGFGGGIGNPGNNGILGRKRGRPEKEDSDNPNTEASRARGTNELASEVS